MELARRRQLRAALLATEPWLGADEYGPRAVDAGRCDRCDALPRLVPTCGPVPWSALCRRCAEVVQLDAWCDGHSDDARAALAWAAALPDHWDLAVTLWWVATGEVRLADRGPMPIDPRLSPAVRDALTS